MLKSIQLKRNLVTLSAAIFCLAILECVNDSAKAQLISYEGFNYTAGTSLAAQSGGGSTGWGLPWSTTAINIATNTAVGLSYGSLDTTGGGVIVGSPTTTSSSVVFTRQLAATLGSSAVANTVTPGTVWLSFLYQDLRTTGGPFFRETRFGFYSNTIPDAATAGTTTGTAGGTDKMDVGHPTTSASILNQVSLFSGATINSSGVATPSNGVPAFLLLKIVVDNTSAASDTVSLWVNPVIANGEGGLGAAAATFTSDFSFVNGFRLQATGTSGTATNSFFEIDEIRLGNTFTDVTPLIAIAPTIQASSLGGNLNLSWPQAAGGGYILQSATNLTAPVTWSDLTPTLTTNAGTISVALQTTNSQMFFHLKK